MTIQEGVLTRTQLTGVLRALGVVSFALIAVIAGVLLRWRILVDDRFNLDNLHLAHFLIWVGGVVGVAALAYIGKVLITMPDAKAAAPGRPNNVHEAPPSASR